MHIKLVGENNSDEDWIAAFGNKEKAKEEVYNEIKGGIMKYGYDGSEDYTAMYWFSKEQHKNKEMDADLEKIMIDTITIEEALESDNIGSAMEQLWRNQTNWYINEEKESIIL